MPHPLARRAAHATLGALAAATALAGPAAANTTPLDTAIAYTDASRSTCENPQIVQPYRAIGDSRNYVLAPHGSFTNGVAPGYQLRNGAKLASDTARGVGLALPAGASVVTPGFCVDLDYPHARLAHKVVGTGASGVELKVEVVYPTLAAPHWTEVKQFDGSQGDPVASGWRISPDVDLKPEFGGDAWGARFVALRLTAVKKYPTTAQIRVDDLFIDPRRV